MKSILPSLILLLLASTYAIAQSTAFHSRSPILTNSKTQITVESAFSEIGAWGHYPVTITLRNESSRTQAFSLQAVSESNSNSYYSGKQEVKTRSNFAFSCPAESEKSFKLLIPIAKASYETGWHGSGGNSFPTSNDLSLHFKNGKDQFHSQLSGGHDLEQASRAYTEATRDEGQIINSSKNTRDNTLDLSLLPVSAQGLLGYDEIFMTDEEWFNLTTIVKNEIKEWVKYAIPKVFSQ